MTSTATIARSNDTLASAYPDPGSLEELCTFAALQRQLAPMFTRVFSDAAAARTVVVIPSMSLDHDELAKLTGASMPVTALCAGW